MTISRYGYGSSSDDSAARFVLRLLLAALLGIHPEQFVEQELAYARQTARVERRE